LAEKLFPLALVEKTPIEHASKQTIREKLQRRLREFPKARFLHVVRNPLTYGVSHLEHLEKMSRTGIPSRMEERYRMMLDQSTDPPAIDPQVLWLRANDAITEFMDSLPDKQKMRIRGEDLVVKPGAQCAEIAQWLGGRFDGRVVEEMKHPEHSPFARIGPPNAMFGGDPKFFREPALRPGRPSMEILDGPLPWRQDNKGFNKKVIELAELFGYRCRGDVAHPTKVRRTTVRSAIGNASPVRRVASAQASAESGSRLR
jgi:hypothetical protein